MARVIAADAAGIEQGIAALAAGELVALPTETVYGLGADATRPDAARAVFAAKGRPADHPLIVHVLGADDLDAWAAEVPPLARALAAEFWPGPLTLVLRRADGVCDEVTGGQDTVGLRCPAHPVARALIAGLARCVATPAAQPAPVADPVAAGVMEGREPSAEVPPPARRRVGIAAPSANRFGRISPSLASHVAEDFADLDLLVLDGGACEVGIESTIVDLTRGAPVVLRPGAITPARIAAVAARLAADAGTPHAVASAGDPDAKAGAPAACGEPAPAPVAAPASAPAPRVSGSLDSHYAPRKPLRLMSSDEIRAIADPADWALLAFDVPAGDWAWQVVAPRDPAAFAHGLYAWLHAMDGSGAARLAIEHLPVGEDWAAVADRLRRAAFNG